MLNFFNQVIRAARPFLLTTTFQRSFAALKIFERQKKPAQLSPLFAPKPIKGISRNHRKTANQSPKKRSFRKARHYSMRNHHGLLKRVRMVGPLRLRRFKFVSAGKRHLNLNKTRKNLLHKRRTRYISKPDTWKVKRMIPSFRKNSFKRRQ